MTRLTCDHCGQSGGHITLGSDAAGGAVAVHSCANCGAVEPVRGHEETMARAEVLRQLASLSSWQS